MLDPIVLRDRRPARCRSRIDLTGPHLSVYLPGYFGARRWVLVADRLVVADLTRPPEWSAAGPDVRFQRPLVIPYLATTSHDRWPNLALLFVEPVRLPPRRFRVPRRPRDLPFTYRSTRSAAGFRVDGVLLSVDDPTGAAARLAQAGAGLVGDPDGWLAAHHPVVTDLVEHRDLLRRERRARLLRRLPLVLWIVGSGLCTVANSPHDGGRPGWFALWCLGFAVLLASFPVQRAVHRYAWR